MDELTIPPLINDLITFISHWPIQPAGMWIRFRVVMTMEEKEAYKAYIKARGFDKDFVQAIRGIPIEIDAYPTKPKYFLESLE